MNTYSTYSCRACESWGKKVATSVEMVASTRLNPANEYLRSMAQERLCQPCYQRLTGPGVAIRGMA